MTTSKPTLSALQHWLQSVITHPDGIAQGIAAPETQSQVPVEQAALETVILPSKALTSEERLAIYGNAYFARLLECMREMFPALRYALDDEIYDQFAAGYLTTYPPHSYTLDQLSDRFLEFLVATREELLDPEESWPDFVIDLARLEWSIEQVFDGPGIEQGELLSAADLQQIDPELWPQATLRAAPCLHLLAFQFPVNDYYTDWRQLDPDAEEPLPLPEPEPNYLALTRRNFIVRRYPISLVQYELLAALVAGKPVGEAIATAAESAEDIDQFAAELGGWFQAWTAAEFFTSVQLPGE